MVDEKTGPPSIEEIRGEINRCVDLIHRGSAVSAVTKLTQLSWRLEGIENLETETQANDTCRTKKKPIYAWEHEGSLTP